MSTERTTAGSDELGLNNCMAITTSDNSVADLIWGKSHKITLSAKSGLQPSLGNNKLSAHVDSSLKNFLI